MKHMLNRGVAATVFLVSIWLALPQARAEVASLSDVPLANSPSDAVLPNLMYILDDSGSMTWDYMPDSVYDALGCKTCSSATYCTVARCSATNGATTLFSTENIVEGYGLPPFFSNDYNQIYYNPDLTYDPAVNSFGVSYPREDPTAAHVDPYLPVIPPNKTTINLVGNFPEAYYCNSLNQCRRNGIDNVQSGTLNYFLYSSNNVTAGTPLGGYPSAGGTGSTSFIGLSVQRNGNPHYFTISSHEYCTDSNLVNCSLANADGSAPSGFIFPAPIRYCSTPVNAVSTAVVSDAAGVATPKCRKRYDITLYPYPRFGRFRRVDIVSTKATYPLRATTKRTDCANAAYCTYAEEIQNFTNWFTFYHTRLLTMKTASARAFLSLDDHYRIGFLTINPNFGAISSVKYLPIAQFTAGQKAAFYSKLYSTNFATTGTPLRAALSTVGRHYAGIKTGYNSGMSQDPVQYACQQNFALLTSDGYYNDDDTDGIKLDNTAVGNQDNVPDTADPFYVARKNGTLDGIGTKYSNSQPTTIVEQSLCTGSGNTTFSTADSPAQTACGCATGQRRIWQRTLTRTTNTTGTDDVQASSTTTTGAASFTPISPCSSFVNTVVTPVTVVEQQVLTGTATSTFAAINGVTANANKAGACTAGQKLVMQRTTKYNSTVVTTDGVTAAAVNSGTTYTFAPGSCVAPLVETTSTPVVETAQFVCSANTTTAFANAANGTNSQMACGCGAGNTAVKRRVVTYTKTVVTTDGVAAAPTYGGVTTSFSNAVNCSTVTGKTAAATTVVNGATSSSSTGGPTQVAAATTTTNGTPVPSDNGGTTLTTASIVLNPNPTVTPGVVNATNTPGGTANTLADVAMYYYKTPLRTSGALALPDVPTNSKDINPRQHMVTFTLGLGLTGLMDYIPNYETSTAGDFAKIKNGAAGCSWTTGTCNWPTPKAGTNTTLDDLWHAAVNGRGTYYSASDPNSLADGLSSALTSLKIQTAAASASATSTPNITKTDNSIYSSTFRTVKWDGEITAQRIDPTTGNTQAAIVWSAQTLLDGRVAATSDTRKIYTFSAATGNKLKDFLWANLTTAEKASFEVQCGALSQCPSPGPQRDIANIGQNMVNYLRGQKQYEGTLYRAREHVLGDSVNAAPTFVRVPTLNSNDAVTPSYATYKAANVTRQAVLYVGANDGMLHAFNGDTGAEIWAYVPRIVHQLLSSLASEDWDLNHQFIVDGSPQVADVFDSNAGAWKTILIAGLNKGGRGYYALDITDPNAPKGLWEACSNSSVCAVSDSDFGYSYGYPVVTKRPTDGKWVALVTSGMNNVSPGTGRGYLYVLDALTGAILQKVDTGAGDTTTPSGFAKISGFANNFSVDNTVTHVYGGDLLGNLWRFDMSTSTPTVLKLAMLKDSTGKSQSITTRPELTIISGSRVVYVGTGRYLGPDDLADPATLSPALPWAYQQSLYAIKDRSIALGNVRSSSTGLVQQTLTTTSDTTRSTSSKAVDWTGKDGWYIDFNPGNASPGERVNIDPQLIQGTLILATAVPNNSVCKIGGDSWFYQFDYKAGTFVASAQGGVVGQKITGSTVVGVVVIVLPDGTQKAKIKKSDGGDADLGVEKGSPGGLGKRVSWRELIQ